MNLAGTDPADNMGHLAHCANMLSLNAFTVDISNMLW